MSYYPPFKKVGDELQGNSTATDHTTPTMIDEILKSVPVKTKVKVSNEMAFINLITELGYRENKMWDDGNEEDQRVLKKLMALAKEHTEMIIEILKPESVPSCGESQEYPHREICGLCNRVSPVGFWVPNEIWKASVHHSRINDIHCLSCFIERADEKLIDWSNEIKFYPVSLVSHIRDLNIQL